MNQALTRTLALALVISALTGVLFAKLSYGSADTPIIGQVSVQSPQRGSIVGRFFSLNFSFEIPTIQAHSGVVAKAGDYLINDQAHHLSLFQCYLLAGCALDSDRQKTLETVTDFNWNFEAFLALQASSINPTLSYTGGDVYNGTANLFLQEGTHNLVVWVSAEQNYMSFSQNLWAGFSQTVTFTVDGTPPEVTILSPNNDTQYTSEVNLDLTINESTSRLTCILDGQQKATVGNVILTGLASGVHNVTVYAWDTAGNFGASETVNFTVAETATPTPLQTPSATPSPSPTLQPTLEPTQTPNATPDNNQTLDLRPILALTGIVVIAIAVGALVFLRRRKG